MPDPPDPVAASDHVIVCGLHALGLRIVEVLRSASVPVLVIAGDPDPRLVPVLQRWGVPLIAENPGSEDVLAAAGLGVARSLVAVEEDDLRNLETALLVHSLRPELRVIVQMSNTAVGTAVAGVVASGAALDVAALAAPSLVQACLGSGRIELVLGGEHFAVTETVVTRPGTLRSTFGDLAPIAVVGADTGVQLCPGRDHPVSPGDRVSVLGTDADVAEALGSHRAAAVTPVAAPRGARLLTAVQALRSVAGGAGRGLWTMVVALSALVAVSSLILRLGFRTSGSGHLSTVKAVYFTVETISTVGYGDFSFSRQATWLQVFGIGLIILGATSITTLFALITDLLLSRRVADALGMRRVTMMEGHVVVIGLGSVGVRVVEAVLERGVPVVVIERDEHNRHVGRARELGVPIMIGDATQAATLDAANVGAASAVAILTSDDLTNLETGLSLREHMRAGGRELPIVLRVFDRPLGRVIRDSFGFHLVRSTSALAAPWFVGAALGLDILSTFYVEDELLLVASLRVAPGGGLAGLAMRDLSARIRVVAIERADASGLEHPPRRDTRFASGDRAFLVGPYEELLAVLNRDAGRHPDNAPSIWT